MKASNLKEKLGSIVTSRKMIPVIILELVIFAFAIVGISRAFAAEDYWQLKVSDRLVGTVKTEKEANKILASLEKTYVESGAKDVKVNLKPHIELKHNYYGHMDKKPNVSDEKKIRKEFNSLTEENLLKVKTTQVLTKVKKVKHKVIKKQIAMFY